MYQLYDFPTSGNCYKIRLLLTQLERDFERIHIDILKGESHTPEFLKINPKGKVPALRLDADTVLTESNAILYYLAVGTDFFPEDKLAQTHVLEWFFFEQTKIVPNIAASRYWTSTLGKPEEYQEELAARQEPGHQALSLMEDHLSKHDYFVKERYTIADIALYAYTHVAEQGGFRLAEYPHLRKWFGRIVAQESYIPITA